MSMKEYLIQDIVLTREETLDFLNNMFHPQEEMIAKRNAFLAETKNISRSINKDGSFSLDIPILDLSFLNKEI